MTGLQHYNRNYVLNLAQNIVASFVGKLLAAHLGARSVVDAARAHLARSRPPRAPDLSGPGDPRGAAGGIGGYLSPLWRIVRLYQRKGPSQRLAQRDRYVIS